MCEVRVSSIPGAGCGVFAKRAFKRDDIVCYYHGQEVTQATIGSCEYVLEVSPGKYVDGFREVRRKRGVAQFINDFATFKIDSKRGYLVESEIRDIANYLKTSPRMANVFSCGTTFRAARDIAPGEELFFNYGTRYWLHYIAIDYLNHLIADTQNELLESERGMFDWDFHVRVCELAGDRMLQELEAESA